MFLVVGLPRPVSLPSGPIPRKIYWDNATGNPQRRQAKGERSAGRRSTTPEGPDVAPGSGGTERPALPRASGQLRWFLKNKVLAVWVLYRDI